MPVRRSPIDVGSDRARLLVATVCRQVDEARVDRGLSYAALGRALGLSGIQVARICQGLSPRVPMAHLARLSALVGLELAARTYPGGQPLRDSAQRALLERLRRHLADDAGWLAEVPVVSGPSERPDHRAWDAVVVGAGWRAGVEAETNVRDTQALLRRVALKQRDGDVDNVLLLLSDSRHHRELVRGTEADLRTAFPVDARTALGRLRRGAVPGNAIVLL